MHSKTVILTLCLMLVAGLVYAKSEKMTLREKAASGKKVSIHSV